MDASLILAGGIILLAITVGLFLIFHTKKKNRAIVHYEAIRDKLSVREPEPDIEIEEVVEEFDSIGSHIFSLVSSLAVLLVVMVIGFSVLSELGSVIEEATVANVTSSYLESADSLLSLLPIIMIVCVAAVVLGLVMIAFSSTGLTTTYVEAKTGIEKYKEQRDKLSKTKREVKKNE